MEISEKLPHVPHRLEGESRVKLEIDDIFTIITFLDENKLFEKLPKYVTNCPDAIPSIRLFESDLSFIMSRLDRIEERLDHRLCSISSSLAAIANGVRVVNNATGSKPAKPVNADNHNNNPGSGSDWPSLQEARLIRSRPSHKTTNLIDKSTPIYRPGNSTFTTVESTATDRSFMPSGNWAINTSTPTAKIRSDSNLIHIRSTSVDSENRQTDSVDENHLFLEAGSRKRRRLRSGQLAVELLDASKQGTNVVHQNSNQPTTQARRGGALIIGRAGETSGMKAAKQARNIVQKSVFCIDNFDLSCTADE